MTHHPASTPPDTGSSTPPATRPTVRQTPGTDALSNGTTQPRKRHRKGRRAPTAARYKTYTLPAAGPVTITRPDGTTETQPAKQPKPVKHRRHELTPSRRIRYGTR